MVDCDYCDASFEGEEDYLDHLATAHEGELSAIDQRRVEGRASDDGGLPPGPTILAGVVLLGLVLAAYAALGFGGNDVDTSIPEDGDESVISQVEADPDAGAQHVEQGTDIDYQRMPPTNGPHYIGTVGAGFYEDPQPLGDLVHSLEHGAVVVYYEPGALTAASEESLRAMSNAHTGEWQSFIAVPTPVEDPDSPYVLAAWGHRLPMEEYDHETVRQFTGEYLGRGPERPVR